MKTFLAQPLRSIHRLAEALFSRPDTRNIRPQRRGRAFPVVLLGICLSALGSSACRESSGAVQLGLSNPPDEITRITVTVSATDIDEFTRELTKSNNSWGIVLRDVPVGDGRHLVVRAYNSSDVLRYQGQATVSVSLGQTTVVDITLQEVDVNVPPRQPPIIRSLAATVGTTNLGGVVTLQADAYDPDGDPITVAWTASSGTFAEPSQLNTTWTAPRTAGDYFPILAVSDGIDGTATAQLKITVTASGNVGDIEIRINFNSNPKVKLFQTDAARIGVGQTTHFTLEASDPDGDPLSYSWSSNCAGNFDNAGSATPMFTPTALPTGECNNCLVSVTISDGHGGSISRSLGICVVEDYPPPPPNVNPITPYNPTVHANEQVTFEVSATDPQGGALQFAWSASAGTLGTSLEPDGNTSRIGWTAPACVSGIIAPKVTVSVTVTNAAGLNISRHVDVTGLPSCPTQSYKLLAGFPNMRGHMDGVGGSARIQNSGPLTYDRAGHLYFFEQEHYTIRRLTIATGEVETIAGSPGASGYVDGIGTDARLGATSPMHYDPQGYLYFTQPNSHTVRRLDLATRRVETVIGRRDSAGSIDGPPSLAQFNYPNGAVTDGNGHLFIIDTNNRTLRRYDFATQQTYTIAGVINDGRYVDGTGSAIRFYYPTQMYSDYAGHLYILESSYLNSIRRYDIGANRITTVAGVWGAAGLTDGIGDVARMNTIPGMSFDGSDSFYFADETRSVIRRFNILTQEVTTVFGQLDNHNISIGDFNTASFASARQAALVGPGTLVVWDGAGYFSIARGLYATTP